MYQGVNIDFSAWLMLSLSKRSGQVIEGLTPIQGVDSG